MNPANLAGGKGDLHAYLSNAQNIASSSAPPVTWVKGKANPATPFVSTPGLLTAQCVDKGGFSYLEVHVAGSEANGPPNLSAAFQRGAGTSPSAYRRNHRS